MKNLLMLTLLALISYLAYLYWQKYQLDNNQHDRSDDESSDDEYENTKSKTYNKKAHHNKKTHHKKAPAHHNKKAPVHHNKKAPVHHNKKAPVHHNKAQAPDQTDVEYFDNKMLIQNHSNEEIDTENNFILTEGANDILDQYLTSKNRPHVFFDIEINGDYIGRIVFELFEDIVPYTVKNFIHMANNNYRGTKFHRIIKDFVIQGGDYINGDGTGSNSIYGPSFDDENFNIKHDNKYLLSMANSGPNTNGCQFFITLNPQPNLDNKHVVFGKVADVESQITVDKLGEVLTNIKDTPIVDCVISDCGSN